MATTRIGIVTSSRADYGHLYWPLKALEASERVRFDLLVTGAHLSDAFGRTVDVVRADGFEIAAEIECFAGTTSDVDMAKTIGVATLGFTDWLAAHRPDALLVIADRYEMMAPATAAMALRIPIIHIEGGEASEGAIDQVVRNALTMMSHVHLTTTELAKRRVVAMGEEPWRVHRVGSPTLDHLRKSTLWSKEALASRLEFSLDVAPIVVGFHPVTLDDDPTAEADALYGALEEIDQPIVFSFPNADFGSAVLIDRARAFSASRDDATVVVNLPPAGFWSLLREASLFVGNSSSGIMETPSLGLPAVNVGRRQRGRETAANTISVPAEADAIVEAVGVATSDRFRTRTAETENPYGDGRSAERITRVLEELPSRERLLRKEMRSG